MDDQPPKDFVYDFAAPVKEIIVLTGMMQEVIKRTAAVHPGNSLWYGESRIGKTTTARYMVQKITESYTPQNPHAYRAVHYEAGEVAAWTGNEMKKGVKSLYYATLGRLDEGVYRHDPVESLAMQLVHGLRRKNIQVILVDEAGTLSLEAIRGMVLVGNVAKNMDYPLSLVFIGMDDLPTKVQHLPQVDKRFVEWCYFEAYTLEDTGKFLTQVHPYFKDFDLDNPKQREQVECIYEMCGGFPGMVMPFLKKFTHDQNQAPEEINITYLRSIHLRTVFDKQQSVNRSLQMYRGRPRQDSRSGYVGRKNQEQVSAKDGKKSPKDKSSGKSTKKS